MSTSSVASIGDLRLQESEYVYALTNFYNRTGRAISINEQFKKQILNSEINKLAIVQYAYDTGIANSEYAQSEKERIRQKAIVDVVIKKLNKDSLQVSENEVRELFYHFNTYLRASHLYAPSLQEAIEIKKKLQEGETFDSLAKEVFENPYLANNGGDVGYFTVDEMDISFEDAAYNLEKGAISEPVKTAQGYSIIKVTDKTVKPLITETEFINQKNRFESFAIERKQKLFYRNYLKQFTDGLEIDEGYLTRAIEAFKSNSSLFTSGSNEWNIPIPNNKELEYENQNISDEYFIEAFEATNAKERAAVNNEQQFIDFLQGIAFRAYHLQQFEVLSQDEKSYVDASVEATWKAFLQKEVRDQVLYELEVPNDSLKDFFQKDSTLFFSSLELDLKRVVTSTKEEAETVIDLLNKDVAFTKVLKEYSALNEDLITEGKLGWKSIEEFGTLGTKINQIKIGEVVGPLEYQSGKWLVFKCVGRKEAAPRTFEQAKNDVEGTLLTIWQKKAMNKVISQTKSKHPLRVDLEKISSINFSYLK
jgi:parvulin-like peptidyl-prolyl isomerase